MNKQELLALQATLNKELEVQCNDWNVLDNIWEGLDAYCVFVKVKNTGKLFMTKFVCVPV